MVRGGYHSFNGKGSNFFDRAGSPLLERNPVHLFPRANQSSVPNTPSPHLYCGEGVMTEVDFIKLIQIPAGRWFLNEKLRRENPAGHVFLWWDRGRNTGGRKGETYALMKVDCVFARDDVGDGGARGGRFFGRGFGFRRHTFGQFSFCWRLVENEMVG